MDDSKILSALESIDKIFNIVFEIKENVNVLSEKVNVLSEKVNVLSENVNVLSGKVDYLYEVFPKLEKKVDVLSGKVDYLYEAFPKLEKKVDKIDERLTSLEHTVTVMEYEHGNKLDIICDYIKISMEKHGEYENNFLKIDSKFFNYDLRLGEIEGSKFYKKLTEEKYDFIKKNLYDKYLDNNKTTSKANKDSKIV